MRSRPLVALVILDGWGCAPPGPGNAVELASTPVFDRLWATYPHTTLVASGEAVGLPPGQMGNSEVGHLTIGAGRRLDQDLTRITEAIEDGSFFENEVLGAAFERGENVHLLGLVSYGGVHSHIDHLRALLRFAPEKTWIHAFTDGRDVSPHAAVKDLAELPAERIATVCGRYYAMDRDGRWERTQRAFDAIVDGGAASRPIPSPQSRRATTAASPTSSSSPSCSTGRPRLGPKDSAIFFNFRPDRARQLSRKLVDAGFDLTTMTRYDDDLDCPVAFGERLVEETLAETLAGRRHPPAARRGDGEVRPRNVLPERRPGGPVAGGDASARSRRRGTSATYDEKPEMSAPEVTRTVRRGRRGGRSTASRS